MLQQQSRARVVTQRRDTGRSLRQMQNTDICGMGWWGPPLDDLNLAYLGRTLYSGWPVSRGHGFWPNQKWPGGYLSGTSVDTASQSYMAPKVLSLTYRVGSKQQNSIAQGSRQEKFILIIFSDDMEGRSYGKSFSTRRVCSQGCRSEYPVSDRPRRIRPRYTMVACCLVSWSMAGAFFWILSKSYVQWKWSVYIPQRDE
jgi:hypothetical protein